MPLQNVVDNFKHLPNVNNPISIYGKFISCNFSIYGKLFRLYCLF